MTKTKFEAMDILNQYDIPCGPILSMKEIMEEPSLRATGTVVEVDHPKRGKYLTVGNPIKLSAVEAARDPSAPLPRIARPGQHTRSVLHEVFGLTREEYSSLAAAGVVEDHSLAPVD